MHITMIGACPYPSPQGSQVYMGQQAQALSRRIPVTLLTYHHGQGQPHTGFTHIRLPEIPGYTRMRSGPDPTKPLLDTLLLAKLLHIPTDLFHAHNYEAGVTALIAGKIRNIPVVYNAHGIMSQELPTYFSDRWHRPTHALGHLTDTLLARADLSLAISRAGHQHHQRLGARRTALSFPGVFAEEYQDVSPIPGGELVYAGNSDGYQNLPLLLSALEQLPRVRLRIVTAQPHWPLLDQYPTLKNRIELIVEPQWERARNYIAGCRVAVLPRIFCGGFPIKLLCYLGLGLPVVTCTGSAQGLPGELPVKPEQFTQGVAQALDRPPPTDAAAFLHDHRWERRADELVSMYHMLLS